MSTMEEQAGPAGGPPSRVRDESVGNEDGTRPAARPGGDGADGAAGVPLLAPVSAGAFADAARRLAAGTAGSAVFVVDAAGSPDGALRVFHPAAGPGAAFDVPLAAVGTVTALGVHGGRPGWILAALSFGAGFESLGATFARLAATAGGEAGARSVAAADEVEGDVGDADPAAPHGGEISEVADLATARTLANVGTGIGVAEALELEGPRPEAETAAPPTLPLDMGRVRAFLDACTGSTPRVTYGLGAKVPFLGAVPGKGFTRVDCSGFVREAIRLATNPRTPFPDGSVVQHEWVRAKGFRKSNVEAAKNVDGAVRIAFLRPQDVASGIGHVVLVQNARTFESHGGTGPDSRAWDGKGWQAKAFVYRLTDPA
ncbi:MAG TPA: hypothetical protein VFJ82_03750 [Longimicrobium sp.]|nr:hypothetical protein [Longimicrobium sp.]